MSLAWCYSLVMYRRSKIEPVNVFRQPVGQHEQLMDAAVAAIKRKYPNEHNRYLIHFRYLKLGLLVDYYAMDGRFYSRLMGLIDVPELLPHEESSSAMVSEQIQKAFELMIPDTILKETDLDGMYGRVTDERTGLDIHLFEGRVHDVSAVVILLDTIKEEIHADNERGVVGYFQERYQVSVYEEVEGVVPHFHIADETFRTCLKLESAEYFHHTGDEDKLSTEMKTALVVWLQQLYDQTDALTNWQVIRIAWKSYNYDGQQVAKNIEAPDYMQLT